MWRVQKYGLGRSDLLFGLSDVRFLTGQQIETAARRKKIVARRKLFVRSGNNVPVHRNRLDMIARQTQLVQQSIPTAHNRGCTESYHGEQRRTWSFASYEKHEIYKQR
ncbi:50S ribosomal protein L10 [Striga asiatica]|uniref:50S ribosomal protein L10 n=1 Tax=Striga asiatica TaxID=4170 RepID=A0A5A7QHE6_STRAF|nr:50S ribosomal protein L10 [Striga asiatica]